RHATDKYHLKRDTSGWVPLSDFIAVLNLHFEWCNLSENDIESMIIQSNKKRHEIVSGKIRAIYGHSIGEKIEYEESEPPLFLYHGTVSKNIDSIIERGLLKRSRQYVHLSNDIETASRVAARYDSDIAILKINSKIAWREGIKFYHPQDMIWLADFIPSKYFTIVSNIRNN
ncbi:TPA: RNA 2'-phosphotransferase, partial [Streptococcus suis]|nr:RNA 2'-phosphotransferase [Streptococcus suis]